MTTGVAEDGRPARNRRRIPRHRNRAADYLKVLLLAGVGVLCASAAFAFLVKVVHPYKLGYQQAQAIAKVKADLAREETYNDKLRKRVAYLASGEGAEREARHARFSRPGEEVYFLDAQALEEVEKRAASATTKPNP